MNFNQFFKELQRRNVIKAAITYIAIGWVVMQAASLIFPLFDISQSILRNLLIGLFVVFPAWILFAWIYEYTPEGFKKSEEIEFNEDIARNTNRRLNAFIIAGLSIAVVLLLFDRFIFQSSPFLTTEKQSIAVLPFNNLSANEEQEYFVLGMQNELFGQLSKISAFRVISPQSTMRYKDSSMPIPEIAEQLDIDYLIAGSAIKHEENVRIQVQLIEINPIENNLWTKSYDRELKDILEMHSEVTMDIARSIEVVLQPTEHTLLSQNREVDPRAYQEYLKGNFHLFQFTPSNTKLAIEYYQNALDLDDHFAPAFAGLSDAGSYMLVLGMLPPNEAGKMMRENAMQSLAIDSLQSEAYFALGVTYYAVDWNWDAGLKSFQRAIELDPNNAKFHIFYSHCLISLGRVQEAISHAQLAIELDPYNAFFHGLFSAVLAFSGDYEGAIKRSEVALKLNPLNPFALFPLSGALFQIGRQKESLDLLMKGFTMLGNSKLAQALDSGFSNGSYIGAYNEAGKVFVSEWEKEYFKPHLGVVLYDRAGDYNKALDWLDSCYIYRDHDMIYSAVNLYSDEIKSHPRFLRLMDLMKFPQMSETVMD